MNAQVSDRPWTDFGIPTVPVPDLPIMKHAGGVMRCVHDPSVLSSMLAHFRPKRYFEFGTGPGVSIDLVKHFCPTGQAWSLDIMPPSHYRPKEIPITEGVNWIQHDSHSWIIPDDMIHSMDFVFADADHRIASVAADTQKALMLVKPDGIVAWHDVALYDKELEIWSYLNWYLYHLPIKWPEGSTIAWVDMREVKRG